VNVRNLHRWVRKALLVGASPENVVTVLQVAPIPHRLEEVAARSAAKYEKCEALAGQASDGYRSAIWGIYGLSSLAVLCALFGVAEPFFHADVWAMAEVATIATIFAIYLLAQRLNWHEEWLRQRGAAERLRYLPLCAALVDFDAADSDADWYASVFGGAGGGLEVPVTKSLEGPARSALEGAWDDAGFLEELAAWLGTILEEQRMYHRKRAREEEALQHRVHLLTLVLFGMTAGAACLHIGIHSIWLTVVTASFPALGAALNGALAQLESVRFGSLSEAIEVDLAQLQIDLESASAARDAREMKRVSENALRTLLHEHEEWSSALRRRKIVVP
jgi:hypothetical protein